RSAAQSWRAVSTRRPSVAHRIDTPDGRIGARHRRGLAGCSSPLTSVAKPARVRNNEPTGRLEYCLLWAAHVCDRPRNEIEAAPHANRPLRCWTIRPLAHRRNPASPSQTLVGAHRVNPEPACPGLDELLHR